MPLSLTSGGAENAPQKSDAALAQLQKLVTESESRLQSLEGIFAGVVNSPLKAPEFRKFLEDHYSMLAMRYVLLGIVDPASVEADLEGTFVKDEVARKLGFAVSGAEKATQSRLDPALQSLPFVQDALRDGATLFDEDEDDADARHQ